MRIFGAAVIAAALLAACGQASPPQSSDASMHDARGIVAAPAEAPAADTAGGEAASSQTPQPNTPIPNAALAYAYQIDIELPAPRIAQVMDAHVRACQDAGPGLCQITGATRGGDPASAVTGSVSLRGEPQWLRRFMDGVSGQVGAAGGKILQQSTTTEDLSRSIVDTEARLSASRALRDRLQNLLQTRAGRLADLLEVERELARVQGDIDAMQSTLTVMRARVDMSALTLNYASSDQPLRSDTFEPLKRAGAGFVGVVVQVLAILVYLAAVLLPLAAVGGAIAWIVLTLRRRSRAKLAAAAAEARTDA